MGQKTNSNFTRLNLDQNYLSKWYYNKSNYSRFVSEDNFARFYITKIIGRLLSISSILIKRINSNRNNISETTQIIVNVKFPSLIKAARFLKLIDISLENNIFLDSIIKKNFVKELFILIIKKYIQIISKRLSLKYQKCYQISCIFIKNPFLDANLIANLVSKQILQHKNVSYILKSIIKNLRNTTLTGGAVYFAGRLHGIERAKRAWFNFGSIPVQSFSENIYFAKRRIKTSHGIIGVKVQIYLPKYAIKSQIHKISQAAKKIYKRANKQEYFVES